MLIILDPGHGGKERANRGPTGYVEADGVLDIALKLRGRLVGAGYSVMITRDKDETVELYKRSELANVWGGNIFISLHTNAAADSKAKGTEVFYTLKNEWLNKSHSEEAKRVAEIIHKEIVQATGLKDRGLKTRLVDNPNSVINGKDYYSVIRRSNMPSLIIESGFHTNPEDEALLKTETFRGKIAEAIFVGLKEAYPIEKEIPKWQLDGFQKLIDEKIIIDPKYWENKFDKNLTVGELFMVLGKMIK